MPFYRFECGECEIFWEKKASMKKAPQKSRCKECNKMRSKVIGAPAVHFKGMDFETNRSRSEKFRRDGMDKDTANDWLKNEVDFSKDRAALSAKTYKRVVPDYKKMADEGLVKKCSDKRVKERTDIARKLTRDMHNNAGLDPHDINPNLNSIY